MPCWSFLLITEGVYFSKAVRIACSSGSCHCLIFSLALIPCLSGRLRFAPSARTISRALRLNEDLTEAIALGHDLGHTPFGHMGDRPKFPITKFLGKRGLLTSGMTHGLQEESPVWSASYMPDMTTIKLLVTVIPEVA